MPTYEYECTRCGERFELFQPITEAPKKRVSRELKSCGCNAPVSRCIGTGAGILFKGSGFYETDYRSESYKKAAKAEQEAASGKTAEKADKPAADKGADKPASKPAEGQGSGGEGKTDSGKRLTRVAGPKPTKAAAKPAKAKRRK